MDELEVRKAVREAYGSRAGSCCGPSASEGCGSTSARAEAVAAGMGTKLGVGDTLVGGLRPGEVIVDLGSGNGGDVIRAAPLVGPSGRAIGVDATPEMVFAAREAAQAKGLANAEFRLGEIEHLPIETATADVVVSDCVINLSPDKPAVFREAFRVLRPGGRMVVSDVVSEGELPQAMRTASGAWAACIAGAVPESEYVRMMGEAGFKDVRVTERHGYLAGLAAAQIEARKPTKAYGTRKTG